MIELKIAGQVADLNADETIEIETRSGLFEHNSLSGSFSINLAIPYEYSARNKTIFQFIARPGTSPTPLELPFTLHFRGVEIASGLLIAENVENEINCSFLFENGYFNDKIADKKLKNLYYDFLALNPNKLTFSESDKIAWAYYQNNALYDNVYLSYKEEGDTLVQNIAAVNIVQGAVIRTGINDYISAPNAFNYSNTPQFFLKPLIAKILRIEGFNLVNSFFELPEFQNIALFSSFEANEMTYELISVLETHITRQVSNYEAANTAFPDEQLKDLFTAVKGFFNCSFLFKKNDVSIVLNNDIITQTATVPLPKTFKINGTAQTEESGYKLVFTPPENDKNFDNFKRLDEINYVEETITDINDYRYFGPAASGWLGSLAPRDYYLDPSGWLYSAGEAMTSLKGLDPKFAKLKIECYQTNLQSISKGDATWEHTVKASAMGVIGSNTPLVAADYTEKTFKGIRFGYVNWSDAFACSTFSAQNTFLDLQNWQEEYGSGITFYDRCWAAWLEWLLERKSIEAEISGEEAFLFVQNFDASKKYIDQHGNKYIISQVTASYTNQNINTVKLKAWTVF